MSSQPVGAEAVGRVRSRRRSRRAPLVATSGLACFAILLAVTEVQWPVLAALDNAALLRLHALAVAEPHFAQVMRAVSAAGGSWVWWPVWLVVTGGLLLKRRLRTALFVALATAGSSLLNGSVKWLVHRPRPVVADPVAVASGYSFPSGHAQSAMVGYAVALLLLPSVASIWRRLAVTAAVTMTLAIGFSRVALGVHYVSDVLAGYALGAGWVALLVWGLCGAWTEAGSVSARSGQDRPAEGWR